MQVACRSKGKEDVDKGFYSRDPESFEDGNRHFYSRSEKYHRINDKEREKEIERDRERDHYGGAKSKYNSRQGERKTHGQK